MVRYDAVYRAAVAQAESVQFRAAQAAAQLRPSAAVTASGGLQIANSPCGGATVVTSMGATLSGRMPLCNRAIRIGVEQARLSLVSAEAELDAAGQDLIVRLARAYFDVLAAQDGMNAVRSSKSFVAEQLSSARRSFEVGTATITDTREAQSRFDLVATQEIAAENDLLAKRIALNQLVGRADVQPHPLKAPVVVPEALLLDSPLVLPLVAQQLVIGLSLGFAVRLVFAAVEFAGEIIGLQMGLNFAGFFDPLTASAATATSRFFGTMVSWLFIVAGGHLIVIAALVHSFSVFPVGPEPFAFLRQVQPQRWGAEVFSTGLWIALPLVTMLLFVNLVLGAMSRVAPQLNIFAIGFPVTLGVGLVGLLLTLPALDGPFMMTLERLLGQFR